MRAMTQVRPALACGVAALALATTAGAQVLASDDFSYPDGSLVPNGGWFTHSGTPGDLLVASGEAVVQHGAPSEDVTLPVPATAGVLYYGIDFTVDANSFGKGGTDHEYFAHFKDDTFGFGGRLDVIPLTIPSAGIGFDYTVGIASNESTADAEWPTPLAFGVTYRATVRYDQDLNIAQLWIDASDETDASILGEDRPDPGVGVTGFALRQSDSDLNETVRVDNLLVGQSFDDAQPVAGCDFPAGEFGTFACANPDVLTSSGDPVQGTPVIYTVDVAGSGVIAPMDSFLFLSLTNLSNCGDCDVCPTAFGDLLIDLTPFAIVNGSFSDAGVTMAGETNHTVNVSTDPALCGQGISLQAIVLGGSAPRLTNAWDVVLGS